MSPETQRAAPQTGAATEADVLASFGYEQKLERAMGSFSSYAVSFSGIGSAFASEWCRWWWDCSCSGSAPERGTWHRTSKGAWSSTSSGGFTATNARAT